MVKNSGQCVPRSSCDDYKVESVVSIDERGQMVIPKDIREKMGIRAGDKLAIVTLERDGKVCCLHVMRAEELSSKAREIVTMVSEG